jgi:hypothetical protein
MEAPCLHFATNKHGDEPPTFRTENERRRKHPSACASFGKCFSFGVRKRARSSEGLYTHPLAKARSKKHIFILPFFRKEARPCRRYVCSFGTKPHKMSGVGFGTGEHGVFSPRISNAVMLRASANLQTSSILSWKQDPGARRERDKNMPEH